MNSWIDPIDVLESELDSRVLMEHQQEAVDSMNNYYDLTSKSKKAQSGMIVMPTGARVIIVTGCINALVSRILGTFVKNNSCIA